MSRRSLAAALAVATTLGLYVMRPIVADAAVASVTGGAFGAYATGISLFGSPQPPNGPHPTVTLPPGGGSVQQNDPDGHAINYGPATLFISGALTVESSGTTGASGSVTSRAHIVGDAEGRDPFRWTDLTQTCGAATDGATSGTTTIVGGTVTSTTGTTAVPTNPPVNHTVTGVVPGANDDFRIVFNERNVDASGVLTITAAHMYLEGPTAFGDVFIGQVRCGVTAGTTTPAAPVAGDDAYATPFETTLNVPAPGLLANDTDANGDAITAEMPTTPANGTLSLNIDGSFTYTPNAGFSGTDSFQYMVHDPGGLMDTGAVTVTVGEAANRPPNAIDDAYATPYQTPLNVPASGVLANDTDPDGDALTAHLAGGPANGTLTLGHDGSFTYTPNAGFSGSDAFTYMAHDADDAQDTATVTITVGARPAAADVSVTITDSTDPVGVRGDLTYTITVANAGPDAAAQVSALIGLPAGSRLQSHTGATCGEMKGRTKGLACELGTMAAGASTRIMVTVTAPTKPATITATVSASSDTTDPSPANNSASEQTVVVRP